jgi:CheY-like chemotaxis protein
LLPEYFTAEAELPEPSTRALPLERARSGSGPLTAEVIAKPRLPLRGLSDIPDDRDVIESGDRVVLIIEDDQAFAHTLLELAREKGFRGLVAAEGKDGLSLARELKPDAISLDLRLPDLDGWVLLDRLKHDPETRHIPIHIVSATHDEKRALEHGARAFLRKPASAEQLRETFEELSSFIDRRIKRLLVVEDDDLQRSAIVELIHAGDVEIVAEATAEAALVTLRASPFDCMVVDLTLPGMSGFELLEAINVDERLRRLPVIVYTGKVLSEDETTALQRFSESVIIKDARSPERLLDETALFLHRVEAQLPEPKRRMLRSLGAADPSLAERRVLVVDDDFRNVFAITALLEQHSMVVEYAENGVKALDKLVGPARYDIVLMDIMMPEMDGYEAMRQIRSMPGFDNLPIIALTAKAMTGDRDKCIEAGASDYVTKPVDPDQLVSLLRVWLYR